MSSATRNQLEFAQKKLESVRARGRLLADVHFQRLVESYRGHLELANRKLTGGKLDLYEQGFWQGVLEIAGDLSMDGDQLSEKIVALEKEVRDLQATLAGAENRNFRGAPPTRAKTVAPVASTSHLIARGNR